MNMPPLVQLLFFRAPFFSTTSSIKILLESKKIMRPCFFISTHPSFINLADWRRVQRIHALPSLFTRIDQTGGSQDIDVLHHTETGQVRKLLDNLGRG